ncbi:MAG: DUF5615 family PIN-like protein [Verrucomicrobiota bacterium]|nr:DUF5615 family PIN-like protein [Verrucomicrobiota bacterium]
MDDTIVLGWANEGGALLVTEDKDFGELVLRQHLTHHGVMLVRLAGLPPDNKADLVADAFAQHRAER